jgi:calcium-translocating P-type ATPase
VSVSASQTYATAGPVAAGGLSSDEAAARLERDGPNVLPRPKPPSSIHQLFEQFTHFFALMLWVAGVLAFVAGMPQLGIAIFVVVLVNGVFAWVQQHRADRAAERLRDLLPVRATVIRDGVARTIDASELVVGDRVRLEAGDRISADLIAAEIHDLAVDTSTLTGESVPERLPDGATLHAGTFVVEGLAEAEVIATGSQTRLAAIAEMSQAGKRPPSPLALELDRVVKIVARIAVLVGLSFFGIALAIGTPASDGFLFAVGVTVALVPEGLLPTVTLSLAVGAQRMASRHALVRRLESVATLGSTTFICTDKTGTLTRNEMAVVAVWTPLGTATVDGTGYEPTGTVHATPEVREALARLAVSALTCSVGRAVRNGESWSAQGDPMEAALDVLARRLGVTNFPEVVRRFPFDPKRRRMSAVAGGALHVKGAPDAVLGRCTSGVDGVADALDGFVQQGYRVLAVAHRPGPTGPTEPTGPTDLAGRTGLAAGIADEVETSLELLGLVALQDPPRTEVAGAIAACRVAGIKVAMITGDHPGTARAIATQVGLLGPDAMVVEGRDLPADEQILAALVDRDGIVLARVDPEDKLRIARALRSRGHVVAMTGDGVNDGPALREADIGVAMGRSGTDVAREAADLVLLDDDFATIVAAIEHGRATFANVRRFLTYHLTDNVAELTPFVVWALSGGRFPLAIGVMQILCLDIGTDMLPALALGAEDPSPDVLRRPPWRRHLFDRHVLTRVFGVLGPVEALVEMAAFIAGLTAAGWRPGDSFPEGHQLAAASGAAFSAVVIGQMANAFACRSSTRSPAAMGWTSNRLLVGAVVVELMALAGFLYIGPVADALDQAGPPLAGGLVALAAFPAVLLADLAEKRWRLRHRPSAATPAPSGPTGLRTP